MNRHHGAGSFQEAFAITQGGLLIWTLPLKTWLAYLQILQTMGGRRPSVGKVFQNPAGRTIEDLQVGDVAVVSKKITPRDLELFGSLSGDWNPLHFDKGFAKTTRFGEPIVHGLISASLFSGLLGMQLPGQGTIYLSQELRFLRPVKVGDTITAKVEVVELMKEKNRVKLRTTCLNQRGEEVIDGFALVIPPTKPTA